MVVMSLGMMRSLEDTREAYYDRYRFADIFAPAKRAPKSVLDEIKDFPGVSVGRGADHHRGDARYRRDRRAYHYPHSLDPDGTESRA